MDIPKKGLVWNDPTHTTFWEVIEFAGEPFCLFTAYRKRDFSTWNVTYEIMVLSPCPQQPKILATQQNSTLIPSTCCQLHRKLITLKEKACHCQVEFEATKAFESSFFQPPRPKQSYRDLIKKQLKRQDLQLSVTPNLSKHGTNSFDS